MFRERKKRKFWFFLYKKRKIVEEHEKCMVNEDLNRHIGIETDVIDRIYTGFEKEMKREKIIDMLSQLFWLCVAKYPNI